MEEGVFMTPYLFIFIFLFCFSDIAYADPVSIGSILTWIGANAGAIAGTAAAVGTTVAMTSQQKAAKKSEQSALDATAKAKQEAEQKALMETQAEEKTNAGRRSLLDAPTSGFGPNKNLARSFLTSL
jgi:hypothetical protein